MNNNDVNLLLQQIIQAIDYANNPANADVQLKTQAVDYLSNVKKNSSPETLINVFLLIYKQENPIYKFFSIQGLTDLCLICKEQSDINSLNLLKQNAIALLQDPLFANNQEFIQSKFTEFLANLFYTMYSSKNNNLWNDFFSDLLNILDINSVFINKTAYYKLSIFLKLTIQINTMIGEQMYNTTGNKDAQKFHNDLKDNMRINDVKILSNLWFKILAEIDDQDDITKLTLTNIGSFISWIDINLIINENSINLIFNNFKSNTVIACCSCISEIISKKMPAENKVSLLEMLNLTEKIKTLIQFALRENNTEILLSLSNLVNSIGMEYCIIIENNSSNLNIVSQVDSLILNNVVPTSEEFLKMTLPDDNAGTLEINIKVFPFIANYFSFLKKNFAVGGKPGSPVNLQSKKLPIDELHVNFLKEIMNILQYKMVLNEEFVDYTSIDPEEMKEYNDNYRDKLKNFQDSVCIINPTVYLQHILTYLQIDVTVDQEWIMKEFYLFQLNNFAESVRNNLIGVIKSELFTNETTLMLTKLLKNMLINSKNLIDDNNNVFVITEFFEIVGRHQNFLLIKDPTNGLDPSSSSEELILLVLDSFLSPFGIFNNNLQNKFNACSSFNKFVKTCRPSINMSQLVDIVNKMKPALQIETANTDPSQLNAVADSSTNSHIIQQISNADDVFENQLNLFETVGFLLGSCPDLNFELLDYVLSPLFRELETSISAEIKTIGCILKTHHLLFAIGNLIRGIHSGILPDSSYLHNIEFNGEKVLTNNVLIEVFSNIAEVVLVTLQYFSKYQLIRESARFVFARLLILLNVNLGTYVDRLLTIFYSTDNMDVDEIVEFLSFVGQFFYILSTKTESFDILNKILTPVFQKVYEKLNDLDKEISLSTATTANTNSLATTSSNESIVKNDDITNSMINRTDSYRDKIKLRKGLFSFIQGLTTNHISSLLSSAENSNSLSVIINDLITSIDKNLVNNEPVLMRMQMNVLINFIKYFGMGQALDEADIHRGRVGKLDGLFEFLVSKSVNLCFEVPFKPEYALNIEKGPGRNVAIDLSRVLKTYYRINKEYCEKNNITNNNFLLYLSENYFPQIQIPVNISNDFMNNLIALDDKQFEKYWLNFIGKMK